MDNNVHFGDYILMHGFLNDQTDSPVGFMISKGYVNNDVYFERIKPEILNKSKDRTSGICYLRNFRDFVF